MKVVQVTKDNGNRDRGFIAIDAICSAFENREEGNVQIMTMDGFWYDVIDDIEKIRNAVVNADVEYALKQEDTDEQKPRAEIEPKSRIRDFYKKYKMPSSAISEDGGTLPMDRGTKPEDGDKEERKPYRPVFKKHGRNSKYGKSRVKVYTPKYNDSSTELNLPAVSGKGQSNTEPMWTDKIEFPSDTEEHGL